MNRLFIKAAGALVVVSVLLFVSMPVSAQVHKVTGTVTDETGEPMIGMTVVVEGTATGATTDLDGHYEIEAPADGNLLFSYVGYGSVTEAIGGRSVIDVKMSPDSELLTNAVVIGYGTVTRKDMTGSVSAVNSGDFNAGLISTPEQLINGKVAGVQIVSSGGSPTSGSTIRIRGGASLNASNDPLVVLDGVPLEIGGISGNDGNFMSLINPADIETMTVLKDASSTAIYGSRASNGVIIITTKKGMGEKIAVNFSTTQSVQWKTRLADMLSYDEFVALANSLGDSWSSLLGTAHTDWNDAIYTPAYGTDNNLSVSGMITKNFPYRVSLGYYYQDGILKTDNARRGTANISLSPTFFDDYLKINVNVKGALNRNRFAPTTAIWNAATFNPTLPVYSGSDVLGGFTEIASDGVPNPDAVKNPLGLLMQTDNHSTVKRIVGNADIEYRMHFLPDLKAHATFGYDYAVGQGQEYTPETAAASYDTRGYYYAYGPQTKTNRLITVYLNYSKQIDAIKSRIDVTAGYDYQHWRSHSPQTEAYNALGESLNSVTLASDYRHVLLSYYARLNYSFDSRYLLTVTLRRDASSRFGKDYRWGTFPSVALAWGISEEPFLRDSKAVSNLKLRASYGVTGQQDGIGDYGYLPVYYSGTSNSQYVDSDGGYISTYLPSAYVSDLKWETTAAYNVGLDFGFLDDRISGSVDWYTRKTSDLIATVPAAAGTNFSRTITTNVGNMSSTGIEASLNVTPVKTKDWLWNIGFNVTWQDVRITNLTLVDNGEVTETLAGPWIDGKQIQVMTEGEAPYSFFVYKQLYDENGRPIEGQYADLNDDGQINIDDRYCYHSPSADVLMGFNTMLQWKRLTFSAAFRASIGNYVYNAMAVNTGAEETIRYSAPQLSNLSSSYLDTRFRTRQFYSDYYVENASFLKLDNITVGYDFGRVLKEKVGLRATLMMQNVFTLTKYTGVDPEISNGFDSSFYPRPRIVSLSLGINF